MKISELLIVALVYVASVTVAYLVLSSYQPQSVDFALGLGAIVGSEIAAVLYHRRESATAPFSVKATVGLLMAFLCVIQGGLFQVLWGWFKYPEISISIGAVGTFIGPFLFYGIMQNAMNKSKAKRAK
ncbi:MAG TPA: hypothetical protein VJS13_05135 [Pyrinomonadaceae bacterium]|nr:hypothetical protein [Pyrinomonadaceae bacterium]